MGTNSEEKIISLATSEDSGDDSVPQIFKFLKSFCCPPLNIIPRLISSLAFQAPDPSTYGFVFDANLSKYCLKLSEKSIKYHSMVLNETDFKCFEKSLQTFDVFFSKSQRGNQIACIFIRAQTETDLTLLCSHCNSTDLGIELGFFWVLSQRIGCNVLCYDYSGYGLSTGWPSENNIYSDIDCAFNSLMKLYNIWPKTTLLFGESIGSVPAIDLSTRIRFLGLIIDSPILSGLRTLCPKYVNRIWALDTFPNLLKANQIKSKVLVMHGMNDSLIDIKDAMLLYQRCKHKVEPFWAQGCDHNEVSHHPYYFVRINAFIENDLGFKCHKNSDIDCTFNGFIE